MKNRVFEGCATALITPFCESGVDFEAFCGLIERQISSGVPALVVAGTTGEAPTLSVTEWEELCRTAVAAAHGRAKVIIGCGSNSTDTAARRVREAGRLGADAALVVTPYYNKANKDGLVRHYKKILSSGDLPVISYNVPSRTGCDLGLEALEELVPIESFCGIKEATGSVSRAACLISHFGDDLPVYSGSDEVNHAILSIGGAGIISVLSGVFPGECVRMCRLISEGKCAEAAKLSLLMHPLVAALFSDVNPIPVKTLLSYVGECRDYFRLPMCAMTPDKKRALIAEYEKLKDKLNT